MYMALGKLHGLSVKETRMGRGKIFAEGNMEFGLFTKTNINYKIMKSA